MHYRYFFNEYVISYGTGKIHRRIFESMADGKGRRNRAEEDIAAISPDIYFPTNSIIFIKKKIAFHLILLFAVEETENYSTHINDTPEKKLAKCFSTASLELENSLKYLLLLKYNKILLQ